MESSDSAQNSSGMAVICSRKRYHGWFLAHLLLTHVRESWKAQLEKLPVYRKVRGMRRLKPLGEKRWVFRSTPLPQAWWIKDGRRLPAIGKFRQKTARIIQCLPRRSRLSAGFVGESAGNGLTLTSRRGSCRICALQSFQFRIGSGCLLFFFFFLPFSGCGFRCWRASAAKDRIYYGTQVGQN